MSKWEKRLQKLRQNPKDVSFEDLRAVLEDYGFKLTRSSGSHHSFTVTIDGQPRVLVVPFRRPVKSIYVREALNLIDRVRVSQEEDEDEDNA